MAHKAYFFAAGATQKRTLHSRNVSEKEKNHFKFDKIAHRKKPNSPL